MEERFPVQMQTSENTCERLERMWASNRQYVRRMLIGLARDIDLADDLLQETYLRARDGISGYRGDNDRAWLSTVARNLFLAHLRRRYVHAETAIDDAEHTASCSPVGTPDHLEIIRIRQAISELGADLRTALLMKHYCGFTYNEIAENTHCAEGTAKWRVSMAIGKLKEALGVTEVAMEMTCADLTATRMLDHLYGSLAPDETEAMDRHLLRCPQCRSRLDGTRKILSALDMLESQMKIVHIIELDADGTPIVYVTAKEQNTSDQPLDEISFCANKGSSLEYLAVQSEELAFTKKESDDPNYPDTYSYRAKFPEPIAPGKTFDSICIFRPANERAAIRRDDGSWAFHWGQQTSVENESAYVLAIRLPFVADLLSSDPPPHDISVSPSTTTLVWRRLLAVGGIFRCDIEYQLGNTPKRGCEQ